MTDIVIVVAPLHASSAETLRAALRQRDPRHLVSVSGLLPGAEGNRRVILLWSAGLAGAVDAQALVGLWSEDRLIVARMDDSPLPLGLRDLPAFPPREDSGRFIAEILRAAGVPQETASSSAPSRHWIARATSAVITVAFAASGAYWYLTKEKREAQSAALAILQEAAKASNDLKEALNTQNAALKALEEAKAAEEAARKAGDAAAFKKAQEDARRAEDEAKKQADLVKQREAAASEFRKKAESAKAKAQSAPVDGVPAATVAAPSPAPVSAPSATSGTSAPSAPASRDSRRAESPAGVPRVVAKSAPSAQLRGVPCEELKSRTAREACLDDRAASERLARAGRPYETPAAATASEAASALPSATPIPSAPAKPAVSDNETLYQQAVALEESGKANDAIRIYRRAARAGSGKAAKRLGEIYDKGVPGVGRDYAESLQWYETARQLGETVETASRRGYEPIAQAPVPEVREAPTAVPTLTAPPPAQTKALTKAAPVREAPKSAPLPPPAPAAAEAPKSEPSSPAPAVSAPSATPPTENPPYPLMAAVILLLAVILILWRKLRAAQAPAVAEPPRTATAPAATEPPPIADAATLFVSYSHKDRPRVEPIVTVIEGMGRRVWMDRTDITGQTGWAGQIVRAIRECRAVVLMASPNSYSSDQVVRELYLAMNHKKTIVPIELEHADLPDELQYILAPFQHHRLSGGEARAVIGRALAAV